MRDEASGGSGSEAEELLEEAEGVEHRDHISESALAASRCCEGRRSTSEWLNALKNGWVVRETVAIIRLTIPMVSLNRL